MNALEKALLIKELHQLTNDLEHRRFLFMKLPKQKSALKIFFRSVTSLFFKSRSSLIRLKLSRTRQPKLLLQAHPLRQISGAISPMSFRWKNSCI